MRGVVIGAGDRGFGAYTSYLLEHPEEGAIVAVAEPRAERREAFARRYGLDPSTCFEDYRALLEGPRLGEFALVATPDAQHLEPSLLAMERGYHVLLEKPMAQTEPECRKLVEVSQETGQILQICHVLRYSPFFATLKQIAASGELGDLVTIQHSENVSFWHYAHSYCRGNWRNASDSSPMILAKSCHDLDILYWLADARPLRLTSLARPTELCAQNKPDGAPEYCIEGCPHATRCPYDAVAMYRDATPLLLDIQKSARAPGVPPLSAPPVAAWRGWPVSVITDDPSPAGVERALRETRYGRCVYQVGDNDQVSSQTVNVLFANGVNASFTMHSTSYREGREIRIDGTLGTARGAFHNVEQVLQVHDHKTGAVRDVELPGPGRGGGHGGGDHRLFAGFLAAVRGESEPLTTARESMESHLMAFAADRAARADGGSQSNGLVEGA